MIENGQHAFIVKTSGTALGKGVFVTLDVEEMIVEVRHQVDLGRSVVAERGWQCGWCKCVGFHSENCEGFTVNDPGCRIKQ